MVRQVKCRLHSHSNLGSDPQHPHKSSHSGMHVECWHYGVRIHWKWIPQSLWPANLANKWTLNLKRDPASKKKTLTDQTHIHPTNTHTYKQAHTQRNTHTHKHKDTQDTQTHTHTNTIFIKRFLKYLHWYHSSRITVILKPRQETWGLGSRIEEGEWKKYCNCI